MVFRSLRPSSFLSTPSARRATRDVHRASSFRSISIHALREEGDQPVPQPDPPPCPISIHALREEGDSCTGCSTSAQRYFYPRPPRGGRLAAWASFPRCWYFYPRPPRGGRPSEGCAPGAWQFISIHALREEGDTLWFSSSSGRSYFYPRPPRGGRLQCDLRAGRHREFLSTPSARRATRSRACSRKSSSNFYPRPPRGGRQPC